MREDIISVGTSPTYREEVERKAWETFHHLAHKHQLGEITDTQCKMGIETLQMAFGGIIGFDFMPLLGQALTEIKSNASEIELLHQPYLVNESLVLVVRKPAQARVEIITIEPGKPTAKRAKLFNDAEHPNVEAMKYINKFKDKAIQAGFELY